MNLNQLLLQRLEAGLNKVVIVSLLAEVPRPGSVL